MRVIVLALLLSLPALAGCLEGNEPLKSQQGPAATSEPASTEEPADREFARKAASLGGGRADPASEWEVAAAARLGWVVAAGDGTAGGTQGKSDAANCPRSDVVVPAGASTLHVHAPAAPGTPAGTGVLYLHAPDGTATPLEAAGDGSAFLTVQAPQEGTWRLALEAKGVLVGASREVHLTLRGSGAAPAEWAPAAACT